MLVGTVSTVRAKLTDMRAFVHYTLSTGIDRMYLFFDDPTDIAIEYFEEYENTVCVRCDAAHWRGIHAGSLLGDRQVYNANLALQWAKRDGLEWLIHIDSDELLFMPHYHIDSSLYASEDCDVIIFPTYEAVPKKQYKTHFMAEIEWFKTEQSFIFGARTLAQLLGCGRAFRNGYLKAHTQGKSAVRVDAAISSMGVHAPRPAPGKPLRSRISTNTYLLHFDCCTFDDWVTKWRSRCDGTATVNPMTPERRQQMMDFISASESGEHSRLKALYSEQYSISPYEKLILRALGLLRRVKIDSGRFALGQ